MSKTGILIAAMLSLGLILCIGVFLFAILGLFSYSNPDEYMRTSYKHDTAYDLDCEEVGDILLERLDVYYPFGFICASWLQEDLYNSKTKCSCYRGKTGEMEVITYYRGSGEVIRINSFVKYASNYTLE